MTDINKIIEQFNILVQTDKSNIPNPSKEIYNLLINKDFIRAKEKAREWKILVLRNDATFNKKIQIEASEELRAYIILLDKVLAL